jgi:hypothetical protein
MPLLHLLWHKRLRVTLLLLPEHDVLRGVKLLLLV